jgi:glycosyltransferase involved in cell wall biosynthesis
VWDFGRDYFGFKRFLLMPFLNRIKTWDQKTSSRPQYYISISQTVANRVKRYYNKESAIVYHPVDADFFMPQDKDGDFYLVVSALVPYKRIDLAVEAFNELGLPLKIIGTGTDFKHLQKKARPNIQFLGWQSDEAVRDYYARCKALIFPGIEDFGITVLEAQACGRPVIAFSAGGALETVDEKIPTGVFFNEQTAESLVNTIKEFEKKKHLFNKQKTREHILQFDRKLFKQRLKDEIQGLFNLHNNSKNSK